MRSLVTSAGAVLALGLSMGASHAVPGPAPVPTLGDPFPSEAQMLETRPTFLTPFGYNNGCISEFTPAYTLDTSGSNETFTYDDVTRIFAFTQTNGQVNHYTFTNGTVQAEIVGRTSLDETGTFQIELLEANWTGNVGGNIINMRLDPTKLSEGTITFTEAKNGDLFVDYNFSMYNQFGAGDQYLDAPVSTVTPRIGGDPPVVVVPEASTWAMMLVGFAGLGFAFRRKAAGAIRFA
jgi:hypothetical protein